MICWPNTQIPAVHPYPCHKMKSCTSITPWVQRGGTGLLQVKRLDFISSLLVENCCSKRVGVTPAGFKAAFSTINKPWKPLLRERAALLQDFSPVSFPPSLSSFTLNKQNTARYSRHILPVAITSMGASAPQTVWCWVPPIGTGYRLLLPTMSVECKCLFKKLCSSIDFISFSLLLARLLLAQVKCLSIMRFSHWSQACCLSHKSRYYSIM